MRINLLPPEFLERQRARRLTIGVVAIGVIVLLALAGIYVLQAMRLSNVREDLVAQEARNAQLTREIAALQNVDQLQRQVEASRALLADLLADRVRWSAVLRDISLVIPGEAWLTSLSGTVGQEQAVAAAPAQPGGGVGALVGQISFNGFAFDHRDVALWLSRLEDVRGFVNPWLSNSQRAQVGVTEVVQFANTVDLSRRVLDERGGTP